MSKSAPVTPVESIIRRAKGSTVILDGREYRFIANPDFDGAHVVEMDDPAHVSRLLRHPEGWRIYGDKTVAAPPKPAAAEGQTPSIDPDTGDNMSALEGQGDAMSTKDDAMSTKDDAMSTKDDAMSTKDDAEAALTEAALTDEQVDAMLDKEAAEAFERLEGRKPGNAKTETVKAKLKELIGAE